MNRDHSLSAEHINYNLGDLGHIIIRFTRFKLLNEYNVLLINSCYEILGLTCKKISYCLQCVIVLIALSLNDKYNSSHICIDMKFLSLVVNINKKEIVEKEVLDEIILIKSLFISYKQALNLE